jgi:hypothetical protein
LSILIRLPSKEFAASILDNKRERLNRWFEDIRPWQENTTTGRLVRIKLEGIPVHGRRMDIVEKIMGDLG